MSERPPLVLVANARLPSERAQSLQVVHMAAAFARAGAPTTLVHARRARTPALPAGEDLFSWYAVPPGPRPEIAAVDCLDWIDRMPRALQFLPARMQELSFSSHAADEALLRHPGARVLSRELEAARHLARRGHPRLFLEVHRVPGGRLRRRWLAEAARGSRGVVAISGGVREDLEALGLDPAAITVEHDAVLAERIAPADGAPARRAAARERLRIPLDAEVAVYTGGLLEWKGVDLLVEAARSLPAILFVIAGGMSADVRRLRQSAGGLGNVRIDGFQPPGRVADYLAAADLGVVPNRSTPAISARYTSPLKVFEAMAAGLPLVASDLPSLRELLRPGVDAVLVAPDGAAALAAGIQGLMADVALRRSLADRGRERAREHTWEARAVRLLDWMEARERA